MIPGWRAIRVICFLLLFLKVFSAVAQPSLPDMAGSADKGVVILSWVSQYANVKSIAVLRSTDSNNIKQNIGYVKVLDKGLQAFADAHPVAGKNFYKLVITFKSGVTWTSNRLCVNVDRAMLEHADTSMPANDSIQRFVITEEMIDVGKANGLPTSRPSRGNGSMTSQDTTRKHKVVISFEFDTTAVAEEAFAGTANKISAAKKKITVAFDDQGGSAAAAVISRYVFADGENGHVHMNLPDDVSAHHYSVKFYNDRGNMIFEVPRINVPKTVIDKRNFQKRGVYKFVLRRDVVELEAGYVTVAP